MRKQQHDAHVRMYHQFRYNIEAQIFWKWATDTGFSNFLVA